MVESLEKVNYWNRKSNYNPKGTVQQVMNACLIREYSDDDGHVCVTGCSGSDDNPRCGCGGDPCTPSCGGDCNSCGPASCDGAD
jgi:hypothetical protein